MAGSESIHGMWSSRFMFILAAAGSAVGLGNIWRFPYVVGEYGGGAFVLVYLACIFLIGIPIMSSEILLGRAGRQSPINTMRELAARSGANPAWQVVGWMGALAGFVILSFYGVIAGWAMAYVVELGSGVFAGADAETASRVFGEFTGDVWQVVFWHGLFMLITGFIVARGVSEGLEKTVKYLMPALFILLLVLVGYAMTTGYFLDGLTFLFSFNVDKLSWNSVLVAMGQAFFTLSLGMGAIMTYGAYMPKGTSIVGAATSIALIDTGIALLAGMAIFPLVFANGLAGNQPIDANSPGAQIFADALREVCVYLAREMARDGEGATRLMTVEIFGALDKADARKAARTIASSNLVKSAVHGADPNWGRLMMALGRSGAAAEESKVSLFVNGVCIMQDGTPVPFHRDAVIAQMRGLEVTFRLDLNLGDGSATAWGCDLTEEYVIINSAYTT